MNEYKLDMELKLVWGTAVIVNLRIVYNRITSPYRWSGVFKSPFVDPEVLTYSTPL